MQDSALLRFTLHGWVNYQRFKGASFICAILLNLLLLIFKLTICGGILLILSPHTAANYLLNRPTRGVLNKILYVFLVMVCLAVDGLVLLCSCSIIVDSLQCFASGEILIGLTVCAVGVLAGWWSAKCALFLFRRNTVIDEEDDCEDNTVEEDAVEEEMNDEEDELHFCQLFYLGEEMSLLIDHVEMCPDETAFIRVVDDEGYTPVYKRKVRRDKAGGRYLVFNSTKYYLDDEKTQPVVPKK